MGAWQVGEPPLQGFSRMLYYPYLRVIGVLTKSKQPPLSLLAVLALVFIVVGGYYYARSRVPAPAVAKLLPPGVNLEMSRVRFFEFQGQRLAWELSGASITYRAGDQDLLFAFPVARFFQEDGQEFSASSRQAHYWTQDSRIEMSGAVQGQDESGLHLETEGLVYLGKSQELESTGPVKVWGRGATLEGKRMHADLSTREIQVEGPVRLRAEELKWSGQ